MLTGKLSTNVFKTHTVAGRRIQMPLALFDYHHSTGKPLFYYFKLNVTDEKSVKSIRERNTQLPASVPALLKNVCA